MVAVPAAATGTDCLKTQVWTVTATDECGNTATCLVTYTWTIDLVDPVFTACPTAAIDLLCNPAVLPNEDMAIDDAGEASDNCTVVSVDAEGGEITGDCVKSQTWTVTATDECGHTATCPVTYHWTADLADPQFLGCPTAAIDLLCNPAVLPNEDMAIEMPERLLTTAPSCRWMPKAERSQATA